VAPVTSRDAAPKGARGLTMLDAFKTNGSSPPARRYRAFERNAG